MCVDRRAVIALRFWSRSAGSHHTVQPLWCWTWRTQLPLGPNYGLIWGLIAFERAAACRQEVRDDLSDTVLSKATCGSLANRCTQSRNERLDTYAQRRSCLAQVAPVVWRLWRQPHALLSLERVRECTGRPKTWTWKRPRVNELMKTKSAPWWWRPRQRSDGAVVGMPAVLFLFRTTLEFEATSSVIIVLIVCYSVEFYHLHNLTAWLSSIPWFQTLLPTVYRVLHRVPIRRTRMICSDSPVRTEVSQWWSVWSQVGLFHENTWGPRSKHNGCVPAPEEDLLVLQESHYLTLSQISVSCMALSRKTQSNLRSLFEIPPARPYTIWQHLEHWKLFSRFTLEIQPDCDERCVLVPTETSRL